MSEPPRKRARKSYSGDKDEEDYDSMLPTSINPAFASAIDAKASDLLDTVNLFKRDKEFAEYYFGDDESVTKANEYYGRARNYGPKYKASHVSKKAAKKIPQAGVQRVFTQIRADLHLEPPTNAESGNQLVAVGMWQPNIQVSQPAERDASYDLILLSMISQVFLNYVQSVEIEAMCIADRVVVSANKASDIAGIQAQALQAAIEKVPSTIKTTGGKFEELYDWQMKKHLDINKLRTNLRSGQDPTDQVLDIVTAANLFPESYEATVSALKIIAADTIKNVKTTPDGLGALLTDNTYVSAMIVVEPIEHSHAEQNLMLGLIKSGYNTSASVSIAGGKRPCTICFLSLCLTREKYPSLRYAIRPGGLYMGETKKGLTEICNALGIDEPTLQAKAKYYLDPSTYGQFMTRYKELDLVGLAQAIARKDQTVTDPHKASALDIQTTHRVPREHTQILESLEGQGLSSKQPTFVLHPDFDKSSFGEYVDKPMEIDDSANEDSSDEDREEAPKEQEAIYTIADPNDLTDLLARAAAQDWHYVQIKNSDSAAKLTIVGDDSTPVRLKSGSNVVVNDDRIVIVDDDNVQVQLLAGQLGMEAFHKTVVEIGGTGVATVLASGNSRVLVTGGEVAITGADGSNPANVELHSGIVRANHYTIITKKGTDAALVELLSPNVRIGPKADLDEVEFITNGLTVQMF